MIVLNETLSLGETIADDGVVRVGRIVGDLYVLEAGGKSVQFNILEMDQAAKAVAVACPNITHFIVSACHKALLAVEATLADETAP